MGKLNMFQRNLQGRCWIIATIFLIIAGLGVLSLIFAAGIYLIIISREMQMPDIEDFEDSEGAVIRGKWTAGWTNKVKSMIDTEMLVKHFYLVLDKINLAVSTIDQDILLIALTGLTCLFGLIRLFRIWHRRKAEIHQQKSIKYRIEQVLNQN